MTREARIRLLAVLGVVVVAVASAGAVVLTRRRPHASGDPPPSPELLAWRNRGRKLPSIATALVPGSAGCRSFGNLDGDPRLECLAHGDLSTETACDSTFAVRRLTDAGFVGANVDAARDRPGSTLRFVTSIGDADADGFGDVFVAVQTCLANARERESEAFAIVTRLRILAGSVDGLTERIVWEGALPPMLFQGPAADRPSEFPSAADPHTALEDAHVVFRDEAVYDENGDGRPEVQWSAFFRPEDPVQFAIGSFLLESGTNGYVVRAFATPRALETVADFDGDARRTPLRRGELPVDAPAGFSDFAIFEGAWSASDVDGDRHDDLVVTRGGQTWERPPSEFDGEVVVFRGTASGVRPEAVARIAGDASNQVYTANFSAAQGIRLRGRSPCVIVPAIERLKGLDVPPHAVVACRRDRDAVDSAFELVARLRDVGGEDLEIVDVDGDDVDEVFQEDGLYRVE